MVKIIYANTKNSDMFYAVRSRIADPFFYIAIGRKKYVFLDHREFGALAKANKDPDLYPVLLDPLLDQAHRSKRPGKTAEKLALLLFEKHGLLHRPVQVPASFPLDLSDYLRARGAQLIPCSPFFPERAVKNPTELKRIKDSLRRTKKAYRYIENVLRKAKIEKNTLRYRGKTLTSELLKKEIGLMFLQDGLENPEGMIIASGKQTAIPHHYGSGPVRPHQPIICDIFPRDRKSGYFADMTRTYFKGKPNKELIAMYRAVLRVQTAALKAIRPGISTKKIHAICIELFLDLGYHADEKGFIHGTGHGIGLDIHEAPLLNKIYDRPLKPGNVVTVEPGLYYPGLGGVRIEDVVAVTPDGNRNLTNYPKTMKVF